MNILIQNIKHLLIDNNLNQTDLARLCGVGQPVINRLIRGETKRLPHAETLIAIANVFNLNIDDLLNRAVAPTVTIIKKARKFDYVKQTATAFIEQQE